MPLPTAIVVHKNVAEACFDGLCLLNKDHMDDRDAHLMQVLAAINDVPAMKRLAARNTILLARAFSFDADPELAMYMERVVGELNGDGADAEPTCVNEGCEFHDKSMERCCGGTDDITGEPGIASCGKWMEGGAEDVRLA